MATLLQLRGVHKLFGPTIALAGVDLEVHPGEVHAVIGENGAGKSTLLNILAGAIRPDQGQMTLGGAPYRPLGPPAARQAGIAYIHQELSLCPHLSVAENILMGVEPSKAGWLKGPAMLDRTKALLESFGRADLDPQSRVSRLSPASQQVVEICRALAWNPRVILMDEPTSSLQRDNVERLFTAIRGLKSLGVAIIYISHFLEEVREIADRYTVLRDGMSVSCGDLAHVSDAKLILDMVGRPVETMFEGRRPEPSGEVLLEVRNLCRPPALRSASFELHRGEVLGVAGLIGSGRTEMVKAIFGLESPATGQIFVKGRLVQSSQAAPHHRIHQGFGYLSEDRKNEGLALQLSVADNITITRFNSCSKGGWIFHDRQHEQAEHCMAALRVRAPGPGAPALSLSGGNQQKVAMARLLHQDPDILLLDEPTRGIDVGSKADLYLEISRLASAGKAILMVSSYLPELFGVCNRIAVMSRGRLSAARKTSDWTPEGVLEAALSIQEVPPERNPT